MHHLRPHPYFLHSPLKHHSRLRCCPLCCPPMHHPQRHPYFPRHLLMPHLFRHHLRIPWKASSPLPPFSLSLPPESLRFLLYLLYPFLPLFPSRFPFLTDTVRETFRFPLRWQPPQHFRSGIQPAVRKTENKCFPPARHPSSLPPKQHILPESARLRKEPSAPLLLP